MRERHGGKGTRLYTIWKHIKQRCLNPRSARFSDYGGRGITVCDEWRSFIAFRDWAQSQGYDDTKSIDRIDNDGGYHPDNCRWVDDLVQARNSRHVHVVVAWGEAKAISEWSEDERCAVRYDTLKQRINTLGWEPERAITVPARPLRRSNGGK